MSHTVSGVTGVGLGLCIILLSACESSVQTSSGRVYLEKYAESGPEVAQSPATGAKQGPSAPESVDMKVRRVAAVEPTLRFPARIGLARIYQGRLSPVPAAEAAAWMKGAERLGPDFGQFVPLNRLVAEMVTRHSNRSGGDGGHWHTSSSRLYRTMEKIRLGAARQHMDAVLVYEVYGTSGRDSNLLSMLDFTIIGSFILPGEDIRAQGFASALLVDVRNGYPYGTARKVIERESSTPSYGSTEEQRQMMRQAETRAAIALVPEVDEMIRKLRADLTRKLAAK